MHHIHGFSWWWLLTLVLLGMILWMVFRSTWRNRNSMRKSSEKSPLELLKERYAKGEIDHEEYEKRKMDLM